MGSSGDEGMRELRGVGRAIAAYGRYGSCGGERGEVKQWGRGRKREGNGW